MKKTVITLFLFVLWILSYEQVVNINPDSQGYPWWSGCVLKTDSFPENEIDTYKQGIEIENSGRGITGRQNVSKNEIKNCTDEGLSVFKSTSYISENLISGCGKGLRLDNNSTTSVYGNPNTSDIEQMNRIYNADSYEIYVSKNSFPWYFHYNVISDYDNGGNSVGDPLLYFDTSEEDSIWIKKCRAQLLGRWV